MKIRREHPSLSKNHLHILLHPDRRHLIFKYAATAPALRTGKRDDPCPALRIRLDRHRRIRRECRRRANSRMTGKIKRGFADGRHGNRNNPVVTKPLPAEKIMPLQNDSIIINGHQHTLLSIPRVGSQQGQQL